MFAQDLRLALSWVWWIGSAVLLVLALTPFLVGHETLAPAIPVCPARAGGGPGCVLCGMTEGFYHMAALEFRASSEANRGAPLLYSAFVLNGLIAGLHGWRRRPPAPRR